MKGRSDKGYYRLNSMRIIRRFWDWWFDYGCAHCHAEVFMWLVRMSEAKNVSLTTRQEPIVTSLSDLARKCGLNWRTVRDDLDVLCKADFIHVERTSNKLSIVVCNLLQYVAMKEMKERKDKRKNPLSDYPLKKENREKKESGENDAFYVFQENVARTDSSESLTSPLPIDARRQAFWQDVCRYLERYGRAICEAFFTYWSEPSADGKKMRWELQRTWSVGARLALWLRKENADGKRARSARPNPSAPAQTDAQRTAEREAMEARLQQQAEQSVPLWAYRRVVAEGLYHDGMTAREVLATCNRLAVLNKLNAEELDGLQAWRKRHGMLQKEHAGGNGAA